MPYLDFLQIDLLRTGQKKRNSEYKYLKSFINKFDRNNIYIYLFELTWDIYIYP